MSTTIPEEEFEDGYVLQFKSRLHGTCLWLDYHRDRGAVDLGIRLKEPGTNAVGPTRVWFQLKGLHAETHGSVAFGDRGAYADVKIAHLREWFEAPEVVYLAVWVESVSEFVAADVRDLIESRWGADVRWDEVGEPGQESIRLWIPPDKVIGSEFVDSLGRHASMRIDTATWRGQFLGHRLDPLRNELEPLSPAAFHALVDAILSVHDFAVDAELDPALVLAAADQSDQRKLDSTRLVRGRLFATLRWPFPLSVEYGYDDPEVPSDEGQWFSAHSRIAALVMADPGTLRTRGDLDEDRLDGLLGGETSQTVVFINATEFEAGPWRTGGLRLNGTPVGLGALSTMVLTTPAMYRRFAGDLRWRRPVNLSRESPQPRGSRS